MFLFGILQLQEIAVQVIAAEILSDLWQQLPSARHVKL